MALVREQQRKVILELLAGSQIANKQDCPSKLLSKWIAMQSRVILGTSLHLRLHLFAPKQGKPRICRWWSQEVRKIRSQNPRGCSSQHQLLPPLLRKLRKTLLQAWVSWRMEALQLMTMLNQPANQVKPRLRRACVQQESVGTEHLSTPMHLDSSTYIHIQVCQKSKDKDRIRSMQCTNYVSGSVQSLSDGNH